MVFNKYYDRALLLMMLSDKENSAMIINFLKFMPEEMHMYIREVISLNSHMTTYGDFRTINFDGMHKLNNDGFIYNLNIMLVHGMLVIDLHRCHIDMNIDEKINLSLQPLRSYDLEKKINIGSFTYEFDTVNTLNDKKTVYFRNYNIKKLSFDNIMVTSGYRCLSKIVPVKSCFQEISLESLFNDSRFSKCSKKRVLNNKRKGYRE